MLSSAIHVKDGATSNALNYLGMPFTYCKQPNENIRVNFALEYLLNWHSPLHVRNLYLLDRKEPQKKQAVKLK